MDLKELPRGFTLDRYQDEVTSLEQGRAAADPTAISRIKARHPELQGLTDAEIQKRPFDQDAARAVIAREYGFDSWARFAGHVDAIARQTGAAWRFESAADAIVTGDVERLEQLLREDPGLVRQRSARQHRATLLHYVADNGLEPRRVPGRLPIYRQSTAATALPILTALLEAGAEVDATASVYTNADTTLGLVSSSTPPARAGVQGALIEALLTTGAAIDGVPDGDPPLMTALANGCATAAETLLSHGARNNVVAAAALGRLDLVRGFFDPQGRLKPSADVPGLPRDPEKVLGLALVWAAMYGHADVARFLLDHGADPGMPDAQGQTALHYAARPGRMDVMSALLERHAPLERENNYGGTVLSQAVWSAARGKRAAEFVPVLERLIAAGAKVDAVRYPTGNQIIDDLLQRHGARERPDA